MVLDAAWLILEVIGKLTIWPRITLETRKWHSENADPAKALGHSDILDRNPVVDAFVSLRPHRFVNDHFFGHLVVVYSSGADGRLRR